MNTNRRLRSAALATLALTVGLLGSACSSSGNGPEALDRPPVTTAQKADGSTSTSPDEVTETTTAQAQAPATQVYVVRSEHDLVLHEQPDNSSPTRTVAATNSFGSKLALLVTNQQGGWLEVLVPGRPTGTKAWLDSAQNADVELRSVSTHIQIDLGARTLTLFDNGQAVLSTPVAIGSAEYPTPTGMFSVTDKLQDPNPDGAYGPYALGLSGRSEVLTDFAGGDGQIGIHGTNDPSSIGQAVSHGCIRVPNEVITQLNELLPLGTPVVVR